MQCGAPLTGAERQTNLALFGRLFQMLAARSDRRRQPIDRPLAPLGRHVQIERGDEIERPERHRLVGEQVRLQAIQFGLRRKGAFPEEPDDLLERGVLRQRMNIVATVAENPLVAIDVTNL